MPRNHPELVKEVRDFYKCEIPVLRHINCFQSELMTPTKIELMRKCLHYGIAGLCLGIIHFTFATPQPRNRRADILLKVPIDCSEMRGFLHGTEFTVHCPLPTSHLSPLALPKDHPLHYTSRVYGAEYHGKEPFRLALLKLKKLGAVQAALPENAH